MFKRIFAASVCGAVLSACQGGGGTAVPPASSMSGVQQSPRRITEASHSEVLVVNEGDNSIKEFPDFANGNVAPDSQIAGSATELNLPLYASLQAGILYVSNQVATNQGYVTEYGAHETGNVPPLRSITCLGNPAGLDNDAVGRLYVATDNPDSVFILPPGAHGCVNGAKRIAGPLTQLSSPVGLMIANKTIFVANQDFITEYPTSAVNDASPTAVISGPLTGLKNPQTMAEDNAGNLYVSDFVANAIFVFAPGANGNVAPIRTINITEPNGITLHGSKIVAITDELAYGIFPYTESGNVVFQREVMGSLTGFFFPGGVLVRNQ